MRQTGQAARGQEMAGVIALILAIFGSCGCGTSAPGARGLASPETASYGKAPPNVRPDLAPPAPAAPAEASGRDDATAPAPSPPPPPPPPADGPRASGAEPPHDRAMLVYTAQVTMSVYQVDQGLATVERLAKEHGGYLSVRSDHEITVRVPRDRFPPMLAAIDRIGDVLHRDIRATDVTDEYVDTDIRIKNARAMQVRLKTLLDRAPVKEALEIEKELRRVTDEIELLEGKMKLLKDRIAYSTVTVSFEARGVSLASSRVVLPFPWLPRLGLPTLLHLAEGQ